jgi:hypothetical protein
MSDDRGTTGVERPGHGRRGPRDRAASGARLPRERGRVTVTSPRMPGETVERLQQRQGIVVLVKSEDDEQRRSLAAVSLLPPLTERGHAVATFAEAVARATRHVAAADPLPHLSPCVPNERVSS